MSGGEFFKVENKIYCISSIFKHLELLKKGSMKSRVTRFPPRCLTMLLIERNLMLKKVTRREAQKALVAGNPVYLLPNRMQVDSPWAHPFKVKTPMSEEKFNRLIMKYEHACCTVDTGTGSFCYIDA